jgi:hypothetical protein
VKPQSRPVPAPSSPWRLAATAPQREPSRVSNSRPDGKNAVEAAVNDLARYAQPAASPPVSCALSLSLLLSGLRPSAASARPFREASGKFPGKFLDT